MTEQTVNVAEQLAKLEADLQEAEQLAQAKKKALQELKIEMKKGVIADVKATIAQHGLTILDLFSAAEVAKLTTTPAPVVSTAKTQKTKGEGAKRRPKAIYYNAQAEKGQELYLASGTPPKWFDKDNEAIKSKFIIKDYAEQIVLLRKFGNEDKAKDREDWLAANPTETSSK